MSIPYKFLVHGPERHAIETVIRFHGIKRWHMIDTTRQQTLAEHSANVAALAMVIARTAPIECFDTYTQVAAAALVHDITEAFTGDIPSPTKRRISGLDKFEREVTHPATVVTVNINSDMLIKLCDIADGIRFVRLHGVDATAEYAQEGLEEQLAEQFGIACHGLKWSEEVLRHVKDNIMFYIYEIL